MKKFEEISVSNDIVPEMSDFRIRNRVDASISVWEPSKTRQEFAEECDINTLMARYEATGVAITHVNRSTPIYMDVTQVPDLRGALDAMREATVSFNALPATVRREFDNDPQKFVDFAQNPENIERMRGWGLAPALEVEPPPFKVEVVGGLQPPSEVDQAPKLAPGKK